jgi:DNA-nicking Smr family endonuclease
MMNTPKLDLHGLPHEDVTDAVHTFINESWEAAEVHIITGHSRRMKHIVKEVLAMYDVEVEDGDPRNPGYLRILK